MTEAPQPPRKRGPRRWLAVLAGVIVVLLVLAETSLRGLSYLGGGPVAGMARQTPTKSFVFTSDDPWQFDARHGFLGKPGFRYIIGSVTDGAAVNCSDLPVSPWSPDPLASPDWQKADVRIAFFGGDDATAQPDWTAAAWPVQLGAELSRRSGRSVVVANFSRPSTGPYQNLLLAGDMAPKLGAHLAVISTQTGTLAYDMVYRTSAPVEGVTMPVQSSSPEIGARPEIGAPVGAMVNRRVSKAWCNQMQIASRTGMTGLLRLDGILNELQRQADTATLLQQRPMASDWTSTDPALLRLMRGETPAFASVTPVTRIPLRYRSNPDLGKDERAVAAIAALQKAGVAVAGLHSPILPELTQRKLLLNYLGADQGYLDLLLASFGRLAGGPLLFMTDTPEASRPFDPKTLVNNPAGDWQLRAAGTEFYAAMAASALLPTIAKLPAGRRP